MPTQPTAPAVPTASALGVLRPLSLRQVEIERGFWADAQELNRSAFLPHCVDSLERVGWVGNFRAAVAGTLATDRAGLLFTDSEVYKTMEALAWEGARRPDETVTATLDAYADLVVRTQAPDGYLSTFYGYPGGPQRYQDLAWGHELYCAGHLIQAAVAAARSGLAPSVLEAARRLADHVCREFGPEGRQSLCGHPEIETALVELHRVTGERRYLDQAALFVDRRGHRTLEDTMYHGRDYYQDGTPVREARVLVGHAVRALYLAAGALDVAVETGDEALAAAVRAQYDRTLERRTYLTGGMGAHHHGESFGEDFELPSVRAYAETCAGVASIHVAWRLLLLTGEERYADVIERTLYNVVAACPSADGRGFFYVNTLRRASPAIDPEPGISLRRTDGTRASWYTTSCCPTNVARLLASLGAYVATVDDQGVQVHQYVDGTVEAAFGAGRSARLTVTTRYPDDGEVVVRVDECDDRPWRLRLRIPGWASSASVEVAGEPVATRPGAVDVERRWRPGDTVRLHLDVAPRFVVPDPRVDDLRGQVAVERGPLVYAAESVDQPGVDLDRLVVDTAVPPADAGEPAGLPGARAVRVRGEVRPVDDPAWPYGAPREAAPGPVTDVVLVPYLRWANRGHSTMRVWLPRRDLPTAL